MSSQKRHKKVVSRVKFESSSSLTRFIVIELELGLVELTAIELN